MSIRELSNQSINSLMGFKDFKSGDPKLIKKALLSLLEARLIAPVPETPEGYLEEDILYTITLSGKRQAEKVRKEEAEVIISHERWEREGRSLKEERDRDRNKAIKACLVIVVIIVIFALFLLILGSGY